jgi:hypothetical protein
LVSASKLLLAGDHQADDQRRQGPESVPDASVTTPGLFAEMIRRAKPAEEHASQCTAEHAREDEQADLEASHLRRPLQPPI